MELLALFLFFWAVIDPIGTIPVFITVTQGFNDEAKRVVAYRAALVAGSVLLGFIAVGEVILDAIGITLAAFQVAGGIVLFLFALTMIFGEGKPSAEQKMTDINLDVAVFPLAVPSLASPGAMLAAVLVTENAEVPIIDQFVVALVMLLVVVVALGCMLIAGKIYHIIGRGGASIVSRIGGMILAAVAMDNTLEGITQYFGL